MPETHQNQPATVPQQPEAPTALKKSTPIIVGLIAIVALIGIANLSSLVSGNRKSWPASATLMRPASANSQQVSSFETQQQMQTNASTDRSLLP